MSELVMMSRRERRREGRTDGMDGETAGPGGGDGDDTDGGLVVGVEVYERKIDGVSMS